MAGERVKLQVSERERRGSADARRLRRQGLIPGVLYGKGKQSYAICVPERELRRVLTGSAGLHAILDVVVEGKKATHPSILKEFQQDPVRGKVVHVDLQEVPEPLDLDVTEMAIGDTLRVSDLPAREGVTYLDDPETVLATVTMPTRVVEPEEMLEGAEAEAGVAAPPEGEAPEGGSEAPAEPGAP